MNQKTSRFFSAFRISFVTLLAVLISTTTYAEAPAGKIELSGKLLMTVPADWESVPPKSAMIQSEFKAPKDQKEDTARITIMAASGTVDANIDRWIGQFDGAKKEDAKIEKLDVAGSAVHLVDIAGTFKESMGGGPFAPGPMAKRENYRMIGAIVETKAEGKIFIKMYGPKLTIESLAEGFKKAISNLEAKQ